MWSMWSGQRGVRGGQPIIMERCANDAQGDFTSFGRVRAGETGNFNRSTESPPRTHDPRTRAAAGAWMVMEGEMIV